MMRLLVAFVTTAVLTVSGSMSADDADPVRKKLNAAITAFESEQAAHDRSLYALFDKREGSARTAGNKTVVDQLKLEREAFADRKELPVWTPLDHIGQRVKTRSSATAAYILAVKEYTKRAEDEKAAGAEREGQAFNAKVDLLMCFEHDVRDKRGKSIMKGIIKLYSNMTCDTFDPVVPAGRSIWSLRNGELEFRWANPGAPNGFHIDRALLARDGSTYSGVNVTGPEITVHGRRVGMPKE